jgi:S-layer protein
VVAAGTQAQATTYTLTTGIDHLTGAAAGNNTFTATDASGTTTSTWGALDTINGGAGTNNVFTVATAATGGTFSQPAGATVTNVQSAILAMSGAAENLTLNTTTGWTGLTSLNVTQGGTGTDTLTVAATTNVTNTGASTGTVDVYGGNNVTVTSAGGAVTVGGAVGTNASPVGAISVSDTADAANAIAVDGGTTVTVTQTGAAFASASTTDITIGANVAPTGAVIVNATSGSANSNAIGAIAVTGGTTVTVTEVAGDAAKTGVNVVQGNVAVTGTTATTSVVVNQSASATGATAVTGVTGVVGVSLVTAAPGTVGVTAVAAVSPVAAAAGVVGASTGTVNIADSVATNSTTATSAGVAGGTITSVSLTNFGATNISSPALTSLTLGGTSGSVALYEGGVLGATNTTLTLNVNNLSSTAINDHSAQYTTLDVVNGTTASKIASFTDASLATLNVSGSSVLTVTNATSATAINVTGGAGFTGSVTDTTTVFNASGSTGTDTVTIAADATKAITGGSGTSDEIIANAAGGTFTAAKTGVNVTGFEVLGLTASTTGTTDASVFGSGIKEIDVSANGVNSTLTNVNTNAAINFAAAATTTASLTVGYVDVTGPSDSVAVTLQGAAASTYATGAAQTVTALSVEDANGVGIGTLSITDNNPAFNYSGDNIATLTDPNLAVLNFAGVGGLTIGATAFTNTVTSMTVNNTGTGVAGLTVTMADNSLGGLSFTGSGSTTMNLSDTVAGTLAVTAGAGSSVTITDTNLAATHLNLTGAMTGTFTDANVTSLALSAGQNVSFTDSGTSGITISGANDHSQVTLDLTGTGAGSSKVDTITLGNSNNSVTDAELASTVNVTVGTGSNLIVLGGATSNTTGAFNINLGTHTLASGPDQINVGTGGTAYATVANYVITGAVTGDIIKFAADSSSSNAALTATTAGASVGATITAIETAAHTIGAHGVAYAVYSGNTYVAETVSGTLAATDTTIVQIVGSHTLTAATGHVVIA